MAILYGTTGDGTTLPVLVDQFGNLLAKGIDGEQGPPGPPGTGELPPDPFEGAILGWQDDQLAWLGGSPVLPGGTYGPFIYNAFEGRLDVPQYVGDLINGQQLYMSSADGNPLTVSLITDAIINVSSIDNSGISAILTGWQNAGNALNTANPLGTTAQSNNNTWGKYDFTQPIAGVQTVEAFTRFLGGGESELELEDGSKINKSHPSRGTTWYQIYSGPPISLKSYSQVSYYQNLNASDDMTALKINNAYVGNPTQQAGDNAGPIDPIPSGRFELTFASDKNFDGFKEGTVLATGATINKIGPGSTMTVSGGIWYAAPPLGDGTGTIGGNTFVSATYAGQGSVLTATDTTIILRSDNGQWIDGSYVTAPEQRIAARKLLPTAIKRATN